jgi:hypothetical protein
MKEMDMNTRPLRRLGAAVIAAGTPLLCHAEASLYGFKIASSVNVLMTRADGSGAKVCLPGAASLVVIGMSGSDYKVELASGGDRDACKTPLGDDSKVLANVAYVVAKDDFENNGFTRRGATYGALVVPFKYQLRGDKQFTGGASLGGYAGYRFESLQKIGLTATPIIFMGASSVTVPGNTPDDSKNLMGFSYGLGLVGTFQNSFQSGLVLGWDRVGKNDGYKYNGKPWIALQIGFAFLQ